MNEPSSSQILEALERVLASPGFQSSGRMTTFLRFVVQHTLNGNDSPLKEFLIAQNVFGRDESFDPRTDTIVRVEARRLRSKLEKYYAHEGRNDTVVIHLAPRGYAPVFRTVVPISDSAPRVPDRSRRAWAIAAVAVLCAAGTAAWCFVPRSDGANFTHSVAVLPCVSASSDPEDGALANGLSTDIVSLLRNVPTLRVVSHGTSSHTRDGSADARAIGGSLGVDVVLECAVRTELTQHRVSARLLGAKDGLPMWTDQFEREFDTARSPTEISRSIVASLKITLTASVDARLRPATESPEASRLYSIGRHHWSRAMGTMQREHFDNAIRFMKEATEADAEYAAASAGLADALGAFAGSGLDPNPEETIAKAIRAARNAIELDKDLAESQFAMAALYAAEGTWPACDRHFLRAIALKPSLAQAHQAYAVLCLSPQQRYDEAVSRLRRAIEIEPTWAEAHVFLGQTLAYAGRTDEALSEVDKAIGLQPDYVVATVVAALAHLRAGKYVEAKRALDDVGPAVRGLPYCQGLLGYTLARLGDRKGATESLQGLLAHRQLLVEVDIAGIYNGLGDVEAALDWLEKAHVRAKAGIAYVIDDPRFRNLSSNPRFVSLLRQMGLPIT